MNGWNARCFAVFRMRKAIFVLVLFLALVGSGREAFAYEPGSGASDANTGFHLGFGPVLVIPRNGGDLGGGLDVDLRYGIGLNPIIVAPGVRFAGYLIPDRAVGLAMPTLRVTLPIGPLAPFVVGGIGAGVLGHPSESGLALMGGGGLMFHVGHVFGIGVEATYQTITGTGFDVFTIGPSLLIGF